MHKLLAAFLFALACLAPSTAYGTADGPPDQHVTAGPTAAQPAILECADASPTESGCAIACLPDSSTEDEAAISRPTHRVTVREVRGPCCGYECEPYIGEAKVLAIETMTYATNGFTGRSGTGPTPGEVAPMRAGPRRLRA